MINSETAIIIIEKEIKALSLPDMPQNLYDPIKYTLNRGGKRIRPALAILACDMFNDDYKKALYPALAIELFHNFTLIHDDLMDNSSMRRNDPTVHVKWNPNVAILAGDTMNILAYKLVSRVEEKLLPEILDIFNETAVQVCEGQMMDMDFEQRNDVTVKEYLRMIGLKTSVLLAASLKIGAISGGADNRAADEIYKFGYNLGMAFQLQDDMLDTFGDENIFGKKIGNDILTNKKTYLYLKALDLASPEIKKKLLVIYSTDQKNPFQKIAEVIELFNQHNVKSHSDNIINHYFQMALVNLSNIDVNTDRKKVVEDLAQSLMVRKK